MTCDACDAAMNLFGIEDHPIIDHAELRTYVCPRCSEIKTETTSIFQNEVPEMDRPADALFQNKAFDAETTRLLGSTFDAGWDAIGASGAHLAAPQSVSLLRELLAKLLIEMVQQAREIPVNF